MFTKVPFEVTLSISNRVDIVEDGKMFFFGTSQSRNRNYMELNDIGIVKSET